MYFYYFTSISPLRRAKSFIWTNLNPLHPRMLCAKFGWNWPSGSGEEDFLNFVNLFSLFLNYLPSKKGGALHLKKIKTPSTKNQDWWKLAEWFWRRRFLKFVNIFSQFCNYLPLEKGRTLHLKKNLNPLHPKIICAKFGWNWPSTSGEEDFLNLSISFRNLYLSPLGRGRGPSFKQTWNPFTQ